MATLTNPFSLLTLGESEHSQVYVHSVKQGRLIELMHHLWALLMTLGAVLTFRCLYSVLTSHNLCENNPFTWQAAIEMVLYYPCSPFTVIVVIPLCVVWDLKHFQRGLAPLNCWHPDAWVDWFVCPGNCSYAIRNKSNAQRLLKLEAHHLPSEDIKKKNNR